MEKPQYGKAINKYSQADPTSMYIHRPSSPHSCFFYSVLQWTGYTHGTHYFQKFIRSVRALAMRKKLNTNKHTHTHQANVGAIGNTFSKGINMNSNQQNKLLCTATCLTLKIKKWLFQRKKCKQFTQNVYHMFRKA